MAGSSGMLKNCGHRIHTYIFSFTEFIADFETNIDPLKLAQIGKVFILK